jgi:uncharacterized heparinase superfamily protein
MPPATPPAWPGWRARLMHAWASGLAAITSQTPPERLSVLPLDPWPGDPAAGAQLVRDWSAGTLRWDAESRHGLGHGFGHDFSWLRDLRTLGGDDARNCARELTIDWLSRHAKYSAKSGHAWRADILAARQIAWLSQFEMFFTTAPDSLRRDMLSTLIRQHRHLRWVAARDVDGLPRLISLKGLLYGAICLPDPKIFAKTLPLLEAELAVQINPDGGYQDRDPTSQVALVQHLVDIRALLNSREKTSPKSLNAAIRHATPMVRMLRHRDGKLAHFNGGGESDPGLIDLTLAQANIRVRTPNSAPDSGYERLNAGKVLVLVDTGAPSPRNSHRNSHRNAHAGATSFEFSFGRERLIVNCGDARYAEPEWRRVGQATAAHSTLSVGDLNSSEIGGDDAPGARIAAVTSERNDADGDIWLTISHDGYTAPFGLTHRRRLYLSASGIDLRGEDALIQNQETGQNTNSRHPFTIRFHLHPAVTASLIQDGAAVLLRLASGAGWRLRVAGASLALTESVYLTVTATKRTQQIVLAGLTGGGNEGGRDEGGGAETVVKWSLRQETGE